MKTCPRCGAERIGVDMGSYGDAYECGSYDDPGSQTGHCRIRELEKQVAALEALYRDHRKSLSEGRGLWSDEQEEWDKATESAIARAKGSQP